MRVVALGWARQPSVVFGSGVALTLVLSCALAWADDAASIGVHGFYARSSVESMELEPIDSDDVPGELQGIELELDGPGQLSGGGLRIVRNFADRFRFGTEMSAWGMSDVKLRPRSSTVLDPTTVIRGDRAWGMRFEVFLGLELLQGPVYPYVDLVGSSDISLVRLTLQSPLMELGAATPTSYRAIAFGLGPRIGLMVPVTSWLAVDASGYHRFIGGQAQMAATAGLAMMFGRDAAEKAP
jgi:hypothetical protein